MWSDMNGYEARAQALKEGMEYFDPINESWRPASAIITFSHAAMMRDDWDVRKPKPEPWVVKQWVFAWARDGSSGLSSHSTRAKSVMDREWAIDDGRRCSPIQELTFEVE